MPSVLVELGFLTNAKEGAYLNSSKGQKEMSLALYRAIMNYKKTLASSLQKEAVVNTSSNTNASKNEQEKGDTTDVIFRIQIAAGSKKIPLESYNFNGLSDLFRQKEGGLYRYFYGFARDFESAKSLKEKAKSKGYSSAFIVAFKDGKKVKLSSAILGN